MNENRNGQNEPKTKADLLFDGIGGIDDTFIRQAVAPVPKRFPTVALVAACLALVLSLYPGARLVGKLFRMSSQTPQDALSMLLMQKKDLGAYLTCTENMLSLRDGTAKLIWQYNDSTEYCMVELDEQSFIRLTQTVGADGIPIEEAGEVAEPQCRVWVSNGIGAVVTPYLKVANGNISYGDLPTYEPEILPGETVVRIINQALSS